MRRIDRRHHVVGFRDAVRIALFLFLPLLGAAGCATAQTVPPPGLPRLPSFAPLVNQVLPAVVKISAVLKSGEGIGEGSEEGETRSPLEEFLRRFLEQQGIPRPNPNERNVALGSGFIIDPTGYIVTTRHVVENADRITVIFNDNSRHPATVVGQDSVTDLALLKINAPKPLPYVSWGDSDAAEIGDWVLAVGNPFGLGNTISFGIVSARGRDLHAGPYDEFLQIDAAINRGNSGGPTFDLHARVIGVNTAIYSPNGGSVGIGFAIPASLAKPVIDQIRTHGKVERGWLGVQVQEVTPAIAKSLALPEVGGALVSDMTEGGPAAKAGLKPGDVILGFEGHSIARLHDLLVTVARTPIGRNATIEVWRNGTKLALSVKVAARPDNPKLSQDMQNPRGRRAPLQRSSVMGLQLATLNDELRREFHLGQQVKGVVVLEIAPNSPLIRRARASGSVLMLIVRNGNGLFVTLSLAGSGKADSG